MQVQHIEPQCIGEPYLPSSSTGSLLAKNKTPHQPPLNKGVYANALSIYSED